MPHDSILVADLDGGNLRVLVDDSTQYPNQTSGFSSIPKLGEIENGRLTFQTRDPTAGRGLQSRMYTVDINGSIEVVADEFMTDIKTGISVFPSFSHLATGSISEDTAVFEGHINFVGGVYSRNLSTGDIRTLIDASADYPVEYDEKPDTLHSPSIDGDDFVFIASWFVPGSDFPVSTFRAIMMQFNGQLHRVVGFGDELDGRVVEDFSFGPESFENGSIAFVARFTDSTEGIYMATLIPTPATGAVLASFGVFAVRRRR